MPLASTNTVPAEVVTSYKNAMMLVTYRQHNSITMHDSDRSRKLLHWVQQRQLSPVQWQHIRALYPLQPATADWLQHANRILLGAAILLFSAALIFFFAYNWPGMHHLTKLAIAASALLLSAAAALYSPINSVLQRALLLGTCLSSGALLALIGQIYQTGADIWQLFFSWALLITPLVLLAKSRASYLLWLCLLELALGRYLDTRGLFWLLGSEQQLLLFSLANVPLLLFCQFALPKLGVAQAQPLRWLVALALLLPLTLGAIIGIWQADYWLNLLCYLVLAITLGAAYLLWQRDLLIVALLLFSSIAVSTSALAWILDAADELLSFNLLALFVIASSAGAAIWLKKLLQEPSHA
jgi:uncharacterized membrane protein